MRRGIGLIVLASLLTTLPPFGDHPAVASVKRVREVDCRPQNPQCRPVAFAFTPDGSQIFYVERKTGMIRRYTLDDDKDTKWARVQGVDGSLSHGMLGITLHPRWAVAPKYRWVYVFFTKKSPHENRIVRLKKTPDGLKKDLVIRIPNAGPIHDGGKIGIGPDGKLYAMTGETNRPSRAQDKQDPAGKVLRMNLGGGRPANNPIPGSKAYSYGHRNSFGFAFDPETERLWETENGPECDDEVNWIRPGRNYGWGPASACPGISESGPNPIQPKKKWNPVIAPTGAAFCDGCGLGPGAEGDLLVGVWINENILRLALNNARDDIVGQTTLYKNPSGVMSVEAAPDGSIFFSDRYGIYRLKTI